VLINWELNRLQFLPAMARDNEVLAKRIASDWMGEKVTDALSDYFFVTEQSGLHNLLREGKSPHRIHLVGNNSGGLRKNPE
jgi:hypothetical protein